MPWCYGFSILPLLITSFLYRRVFAPLKSCIYITQMQFARYDFRRCSLIEDPNLDLIPVKVFKTKLVSENTRRACFWWFVIKLWSSNLEIRTNFKKEPSYFTFLIFNICFIFFRNLVIFVLFTVWKIAPVVSSKQPFVELHSSCSVN